MLSAFVCALALRPATITLQPGYYTLSELAREISRQGVPIRSGSDCAEDVYAISLEHVAWPSLRAALQEDERLLVVDTKPSPLIQRAPKGKAADGARLGRYLTAVATPVHTAYTDAVNACKKLQNLPDDQRVNVASTEQIAGDSAATDVVTTWTSGNLSYATIAFASLLSSPSAPQFSRLVESSLDLNPELIVPDGVLKHFKAPGFDAGQLTDSELAEFARSGRIAGRLTFDPITFATQCFTMGYSASPKAPILGMGIEHVSPSRILIAPDAKAILDPFALAALRSRAAATASVLAEPEFARPVDFGDRPIAASTALLRWADATNGNLLSYVAAFADYHVAVPKDATLAKLVALVNANHIEASWLETVARERVGDDISVARLPALHLDPTLTVSRVSGVLVVRNELRFLDGLCVSPPGVPTSWENKMLQSKLPTLDEVSRHLLSLSIPRWQSCLFSSNYLRFCNPIAFRPFAIALRNSASLRDTLRQLAPGKSASVPLAEIEPAARDALKAAIVECGPWGCGGCAWGDTTMMTFLLRDNEGRNPKIEMRNDGGRYTFRFVQYDESPWSAWLTNVDVR